jgi:adenine phosphoribosyltransferase
MIEVMDPAALEKTLQAFIRDVPDFPKPGIVFKDITPLLQDAGALRLMLEQLAAPFQNAQIDQVVGIESRGFILGAPIAYLLNCGFALVRKPGKLPADKFRKEYALEYGTDVLEIHRDAVAPGQRVLVVDDLLATGGTVSAAVSMLDELGAEVVGAAFAIELTFLNGREKLPPCKTHSLIRY